MKKLLILMLVVVVAFGSTTLLGTTQAEAAGQTEFKFAAWYLPPPGWHGNPFGPWGVGAAWWIIYEPAFFYIPGTGEFVPRLAVEKEILDGGERLILHLREGVVWHDGDPFCSKDVLTTLNLLTALHGWGEFILDITAIDEHTVEYHFVAPIGIGMVPILGETIRCAHHIFGIRWDEEALAVVELQREVWALEREGQFIPQTLQERLAEKRAALLSEVLAWVPLDEIPIGTGPFELAEIHVAEMVFTRFADHWAAEYVKFEVVRAPRWVAHELLWGMLKAGALDMTHPATGIDLTEALLAAQPKLRHALVTDLCSFVILVNHRKFPLNIPEFRHALLHALDRAVIRDVSMPWGLEIDVFNHGVLPSFEELWLSPEFLAGLTRYEHSPARAEAILLELGFTRGADGNWLDPEGQPLELVMRPFAPHTDWVLAGEEVARQLTEFGIPTTILLIPMDMREAVYLAGDFCLSIEFGATWWGTGHPYTGFYRLFGGLTQMFAGFEEWPVVTIDGVVYDTGALVLELAVVVCPVREIKLVEKLALVMNEWAPHLEFVEKTLQIFHIDGIRVTGWPDVDDPVWTLAPGGIERVWVLLMTQGILRPVE